MSCKHLYWYFHGQFNMAQSLCAEDTQGQTGCHSHYTRTEATIHLNWTTEDWKNVTWSDQSISPATLGR